MKRSIGTLTVVALAALAPGCGGGDDSSGGGGGGSSKLPTTPPTEVTKVASDGFKDPLDTVVHHDGSEVYFTAYTLYTPALPAVFRVPAAGGAAEPLHTGAPLGLPTGLVLSCDSKTLFIADRAPELAEEETNDAGALYTLATAGGTLSPLTATGIGSPSGLALSVDCKTLYVTGFTPDGQPAVFTLPIEGGDATVLYAGDPLISPSGVHVDDQQVAWVMDHLGIGDEGEGTLYALKASGEISPVIGKITGGVTMGVSLVAGGVTAVMPSLDENGKAELVTASTATGEVTRISVPDMVDPGGVRTARNAGVLAITDHDGSSIFIAK